VGCPRAARAVLRLGLAVVCWQQVNLVPPGLEPRIPQCCQSLPIAWRGSYLSFGRAMGLR
jgi:hypothetical protein